MKKINKLLFSFLLLSSILVTVETNSKYFSSTFGLAWQTHITEFKMLKDVFVIEEKQNDSGSLWGPDEGIYESMQTPSGGTIESGEKYYYIYESDFVNGAGNQTLLNSLSNVEFNVKNDTDKDLVITFDICYYTPKSSSGISNLYYSIYNSYLYPNTDINNDNSTENPNLLFGEFIVQPVDRISYDSTMYYWKKSIWESITGGQGTLTIGVEETGDASKYADVLSARIGDADNNGVDTNGNNSGTDYYVHKVQINPYGVINANKNYFSSPDTLLSSFTVKPGQHYSYNINIFYGSFGAISLPNNAPKSFFSSVSLIARPLAYDVSFFNNSGTSLYNFGETYPNPISLSEGSFFNNYGIKFPDLSPNSTSDINSNWLYYTKDGIIVDKGTEGAIEQEFTYFTRVTQDMKVYSKT